MRVKPVKPFCAALFLVLLPVAWTAQAQRLRPHVELPDEPVRSVIFAHCSSCHGIDEYAYHALTRNDWGSLIENLHGNDLRLPAPARELLLDYLGESFGAQTIAYPRSYVPPEVTGAFSNADARVFLDRVCTECHELRVFNRRESTGRWRELLLEMRGNGATLSDENLEMLAQWLGTVQGPQ